MRRFGTCLLMILGVSGCVAPTEKMDGRKFLERQEGPKVTSQEDLLKISAEKATKEGDFNRAGQFYTQLVDKYPDKVEYKVAIGESFRRLGNGEAAIKVYEEILAKDTKNIEALEGKGLALMAKGEFVEAGKIFEQVLGTDKTRWRTLNAAGVLFAMKNLIPEATAYYDQALASSPNNSSILNNKALTLAMDKQYDQAIALLTRAAQGVPADSREKTRLDLNLAMVYAVAGKLDDAQRVASLHLQGRELYNNMGYYAYLAKDKDMAKSYLNMALTKSPAYYDKAWQNLEEVDQQNNPGNKGKAIKLKDGKAEEVAPAQAPFQTTAPAEKAASESVPKKAEKPGKSEKKSSKKNRSAKESKKESAVEKLQADKKVEKPAPAKPVEAAPVAEKNPPSSSGFSIAPTVEKTKEAQGEAGQPVAPAVAVQKPAPVKEDALLKLIQSK